LLNEQSKGFESSLVFGLFLDLLLGFDLDMKFDFELTYYSKTQSDKSDELVSVKKDFVLKSLL
jgi:hypothetical protein